jgi:hypothetical protein
MKTILSILSMCVLVKKAKEAAARSVVQVIPVVMVCP